MPLTAQHVGSEASKESLHPRPYENGLLKFSTNALLSSRAFLFDITKGTWGFWKWGRLQLHIREEKIKQVGASMTSRQHYVGVAQKERPMSGDLFQLPYAQHMPILNRQIIDGTPYS
eukprot:395082-Amphidinium_carterae.1